MEQIEELTNQRNQLIQQLNQLTSLNNTLFWSFKILEFKDCFDSEFVKNISDNIVQIMTPSKDET